MNFWRNFFLNFLIFFTKKLFYFSRILETNCRLKSAVPDFLSTDLKFWLVKRRAGGAPSPPGFQVCYKNWMCGYRLWKLDIPTKCRVITLFVRNPNKKQKSQIHAKVWGKGGKVHFARSVSYFFVFVISQRLNRYESVFPKYGWNVWNRIIN